MNLLSAMCWCTLTGALAFIAVQPQALWWGALVLQTTRDGRHIHRITGIIVFCGNYRVGGELTVSQASPDQPEQEAQAHTLV